MLIIKKDRENEKLVLFLEGRLDTTTAPELEKSLDESLEGVTELILDVEKLEYMSSAGLRVLLSTTKKMAGKGEMKVIHAGEVLMEIFEVTGFVDILNIEE